MIDRAIGITGLALAVIFGVLEFAADWPVAISLGGGGVGLFLIGISLGLLVTDQRRSRGTKPADSALLRLHVYPDARWPDRLASTNIFRWYLLQHVFVSLSSDGPEERHVLPALFVTFDPEVRVGTLKVRSPDVKLPRHEVKDFNQRFAVGGAHVRLPVSAH